LAKEIEIMNSRASLITGASLGFLTVALGAFGAHALKELLIESGRLETYELATRYRFYHSLALLFIGQANKGDAIRFLRYAALFFLIGVILFSGSLYMLSFTGAKSFAMITPLGGLSFIVGWLLTIFSFIKRQ
jgi:uncharacterized membrane protein YgdD (TMEM256/DUF423 family)